MFIPLPRVLLKCGVDSLSELLHSVYVLQPLHVRVKQYDGPQTTQLRLVHRHLLHLRHKLNQDSEDQNIIITQILSK